jgi:hypothetical protein
MDMEFCSEFRSQGLYFNEDRQLVIYNGRWIKIKTNLTRVNNPFFNCNG